MRDRMDEMQKRVRGNRRIEKRVAEPRAAARMQTGGTAAKSATRKPAAKKTTSAKKPASTAKAKAPKDSTSRAGSIHLG